MLQKLIALILLSLLATVQASELIVKQVKTELVDELYPITSIIPGYKAPVAKVPKFAVGDFRVSSDEITNISHAIAEILRYRIQYVPDVKLAMPHFFVTHTDAQIAQQSAAVDQIPLLVSKRAFKNLHDSSGIETVLTGQLEINDEQYQWQVELVDAVTGEIINSQKLVFPRQKLSEQLIKVSLWVYDSLKVKLSEQQRAFVTDSKTLKPEAVESFIENRIKLRLMEGPAQRDAVNALRKQYPEFALYGIYALITRLYANNLDEAYKNLEMYKEIQQQHKDHVGIEFEIYRVMEVGVLPRHENAARLSGMKKLVIENPDDPMIMINFAENLVSDGNTRDAITVMLKAIELWPDNYRVWWSLGYTVNEHAWQVRGNGKWRDVPDRAREKFKTLADIADRAIDRALALNMNNGELWRRKISTMGSINGYSNELMAMFDKAISMTPHEPGIYRATMNFATNKWGGNEEARQHIYAQAIKNNPDAAWPEAMTNYLEPRDKKYEKPAFDLGAEFEQLLREGIKYFKDVLGSIDGWKAFALTFGFVFVFVFVAGFGLGRLSAQKEQITRDRSGR